MSVEIIVGDIVSYASKVWRVIALNDRYAWLASPSPPLVVPAKYSIRVERAWLQPAQDAPKDDEHDEQEDE